MAGAELQLMVFDTRRGNREGGEDDKLLAFHPPACPAVHQSGLAGLLQGLLLFTSNFEPGAGRPRWDVAETDSGTWVMHEPEPHLWFAALAPHAWLPRHSTEHGLRALLVQAHRLAGLLCGSVQGLLDQDPGGTLARRCLQAVVGRLGAALASPHSWQHRELRNPLGDASLPPALQLPPSGALAVQSLCNLALQAPAPPGEPRPVAGVLLLHGPHLLWSSLPPRDTAAVFSLIATGLLHASASSSGSGAANGSAASSGGPDLSALDGGCWQQLPSGFLALRDSLDAAITGEGAPAVQLPLLHLQQPPSSTSSAGGGEDGGGEQQQAAAAAIDGQRLPQQLQPGYRLLPLLEGKLLVGLLLAPGVTPTAQLLASLHALLAVPARLLAVQVGEEVRQAYRGEAGHLPGFRYLHQDGGRGVAHASPRVKVSAMSHHARTLAAALRTSLGRGPEAGGDAEALGEWGEEGVDADGLPTAEQQQQPSAAAGAAGMQAPGDHEILEVLAKSGQDVWAAAWRPGDGRQLLAVRERRAERELPEAGEAMAAFAARNFMI